MYPQVFGKYVLERELSRGGMARVILATLRGAGGFEKRLVVKQIRDELAMDQAFVRRLVDEAKTTVALAHPNIVPVYELGIEQGTYFIAMELVEGISVTELVGSGSSKKPLSPEEGAYIGAEVCRALDYAHRRMKVVHRDITPRNVMLDEEGQVKVIDFGIAAPALAGGVEIFGSPGHMPPEQMRGEELGPPTDIFAVAVLLMEAWSGHAIFRRPTPEESEAAMRAPHPKPSDYDPRLSPLDEVIGRALSLDPKTRPQSAEELGRALRKFSSGFDLQDIARELGERVRRRRALTKPTPLGQPSRRALPSASELETKTFAQREEIQRWKSEAPPAPEPGTRKIEDEKIEAMSPRRIVPDDAETLATRPLETPVDERTAPRPRPKPRSRWLPLAAIAVLGGAGVFLWRAQARTTPRPATTPATSAPVTTAPPPASSPVTAPPPSSAPPPGVSASSVPDAKTGLLRLFGDPGTTVSVDGAEIGKVPVDFAVAPGSHDVRFIFKETGESNGMTVIVRPNERVRMHAEFTATTPRITIQR